MIWMARARGLWASIEPASAIVIYLEWSIWIGLLVVSQVSALHADSTADWLVANAARDGLSPFTDLRELANQYDTPYITPGLASVGDKAWVHPRTPAALLVLQPMTLISPDALHTSIVVVSMALLGLMGVRILGGLMGQPWSKGLLLATPLIVSGPTLRSMQFGAWSVILAAVLGAAWLAMRDERSLSGGLMVGLAMGIRLFPGLLLIPMLIYGRRKAVAVAIATAVLLNVAGALALGISPADSVDGLRTASDVWLGVTGNGSLVAKVHDMTSLPIVGLVVALTLIVAAFLFFWDSDRRGFENALAIAMVSMLLVSPLAWEHYDVMLFLVAAYLLGAGKTAWQKGAAWIWLAGMTVGFVIRQPFEQAQLLHSGVPSLVGRVLLIGALMALFHDETDSIQVRSNVQRQSRVAANMESNDDG